MTSVISRAICVFYCINAYVAENNQLVCLKGCWLLAESVLRLRCPKVESAHQRRRYTCSMSVEGE